ncbi:putative exosome complex component rrp40 isoform X2 [Corticium candelabrum]|uniref:putative exosome complex component rrp40 isoform X2 n=1 Tax=Corticium candelabrum TaxID=121492 RepID=UPI002E258689|nr:putative exosome complex component rrp40 isoform X2 [Corticium candelabrum]
MDAVAGSVVLPGDVLGVVSGDVQLRLGPGVRVEHAKILASKFGVLRFRKPNIYWIDINHKKYAPLVKERVIGVVIGKPAFEGATKRNRPNVQIGDLLYCEINVANKDMEPELVCIDHSGKAHGMGVLSTDGFMFRCSLGLAQKLLADKCPILKLLSSHFSFEIAVGMNGCVWVKSKSVANTIIISNIVENSEFLSLDELEMMVNQVAKA